jgi:hypothetical protein
MTTQWLQNVMKMLLTACCDIGKHTFLADK